MGVMGAVISYAFSYSSSSGKVDELNKPYQTFMLLLMISSVAMIMEYLILVPEYMSERRIFLNERRRGVVSNQPYVIACMLTEVPRGVLHSAILIAVSYMFHSMNSDPTNVIFCIVTLMCGCVSWQGVICMVSCMFNEENYVYNMLFVVLGGGTLFGGLLVKLKDIPMVFKPIYYVSVTAITQRALVVNDFLCCYLTASCDESSSSVPFNSTAAFSNGILSTDQCPEALAFVGDGSDEGNLGRLALSLTGLDNIDPFVELTSIFCIAVASRIFAVVVLRIVQRGEEKLKEVNELKAGEELKEMLGGQEVGGGGEGDWEGGDVEMSEFEREEVGEGKKEHNNNSSFTI